MLTQLAEPTTHDEGAGQLLGARFPQPWAVSWALKLHERAGSRLRLDGAQEGGKDFYLSCAGGTVGVRMTDPDRSERTKESRARARSAGGALGWYAVELDTRDAFGRPELELRPLVDELGVPTWAVRLPDRVITSWSAKSRRHMTRTLAELDYAPLFAAGRSPAMLTLTYPGAWEAVAPSGKAVKRHLRALMKRWNRTYGHFPPYLWKLEFQRRGAPHLHLFAVPESAVVSCSCCGERVDFRTWLSHAWADVVAHPDPEERRRHRLAGTGVDYREGARASDPKRLAVYFTKHGGAAGGKEYQHQVPVLWQHPTRGPGRFWGHCGLVRTRREVGIEVDRYVQLRRTLRRYSRAQRLTRSRRVPRGVMVDTTTGELCEAWRSVTRRSTYLDHGGLAGGWLCVNDGPAFVAKLASSGEGRGFAAAVRAWQGVDDGGTRSRLGVE